MKTLLILVLAALLTGCVSTVPEETIPHKPDSVPETVAEAEEIPSIDPDTPYTGEMFYFTKLPADETVPPTPEDETVVIPPGPIETYRALAALSFDLTALPRWADGFYPNTLISYMDENPQVYRTKYPRMTTDGILYPVELELFDTPAGYTSDGKAYYYDSTDAVDPDIPEADRDYTVYLRISDDSMLRLTFFSYTCDEDFEKDLLLPLLSACRTWTPGLPLRMQKTTNSEYQEEPSADYRISVNVPELWKWDDSTTEDFERLLTNRYADKRMEIYPITYSDPLASFEHFHSMGIPEPITGTTDEGLPYEIYAYAGGSEGESLDCTWYFANFAYDGRYIAISFLTYEDDPADYFDTVTLPVIRSTRIELAE